MRGVGGLNYKCFYRTQDKNLRFKMKFKRLCCIQWDCCSVSIFFTNVVVMVYQYGIYSYNYVKLDCARQFSNIFYIHHLSFQFSSLMYNAFEF